MIIITDQCFLAIRLSGLPVFRNAGYPVFWLGRCRSATAELGTGFLERWLSDYPAFRPSGFPALRSSGFPVWRERLVVGIYANPGYVRWAHRSIRIEI